MTTGEMDRTIDGTQGLPRRSEGEAARLERYLAARPVHDQKLGCTVPAADLEQIELLAARHGYLLHVRAVEEPGRVWVEFWPRQSS